MPHYFVPYNIMLYQLNNIYRSIRYKVLKPEEREWNTRITKNWR